MASPEGGDNNEIGEALEGAENPQAGETPTDPGQRARLREVAGVFFRLGTTAFGGPLAHIAMMEREVVARGWVTRQQFLDLVGVTNLLPGPNSTEMSMHLGHARAGLPGLVVGGACFILPAAMITLAFAWAYVSYGRLPETAAILYGTKPVIVAVVAQALVRLAKTAVKGRWLAALGAGAVIASALGAPEVPVLAATGVVAALFTSPKRSVSQGEAKPSEGEAEPNGNDERGLTMIGFAAAGTGAVNAVPFGLGTLFLTFAKIGWVLFGSGYVLLSFLRADLVERLHWLTEAQLLDAVTVGQITPGPVFTTATFVGFLLGGGPGAAVATIGIFFPAFVLVALSGPIVRRIRSSARAGALLDGVNVASLALMAVVTARLGRAAIVDPITASVALVSLVILLRFRPNATWLVLGGALLGLALKR